MDGSIPMNRLEGTVKNGQVRFFQVGASLDGLLFVEKLENLFPFFFGIAQPIQSSGDRIVDNFQDATAHKLLVLDEGNIGLDPRRVTIHHECDGTCRGQHRYLRISIAMALTLLDRSLPHLMDGTQ